jgi:hypothetical protein
MAVSAMPDLHRSELVSSTPLANLSPHVYDLQI